MPSDSETVEARETDEERGNRPAARGAERTLAASMTNSVVRSGAEYTVGYPG